LTVEIKDMVYARDMLISRLTIKDTDYSPRTALSHRCQVSSVENVLKIRTSPPRGRTPVLLILLIGTDIVDETY